MLIWIGSPQVDNHSFVFLDRDGVVNEDRPDYIRHWREYRFYPDALEALRWLRERNVNVILISNQSGLHRGIIKWGDFWELHHQMISSIRQSGGDILAAVYCPHRPEEGCSCRKPSPQMILAAARIYEIPLGTTYMIGDRSTDVAAANGAGCHGLLVDRLQDYGAQAESFGVEDDMRFRTLTDAVSAIQWNPRNL